jgi:S-adenosylmethionine:tRNA ribosyltransferase-isomerase
MTDLSSLDAYDYDLPARFIAQTPATPRDSSRLLAIQRGQPASSAFAHHHFSDLPQYLRAGDLLVINQTRVIPARLAARKASGGQAEILLVEKVAPTRWLAIIGGKRITVGARLMLANDPLFGAEIVEDRGQTLRVVEFGQPIEPHLESLGVMPLPPYIQTPLADPERYQTIYAQTAGSVAAPTAGLHFTDNLLAQLAAMQVELVRCTLHVGIGTFLPVRAEQIAEHRLHAEHAELTTAAANQINAAKHEGRRVIAVGTTSVRTLETAAQLALAQNSADCVIPFAAPTEIFIMPGFSFRATDALITNFHLPKSTLLMLVAAFAGRDLMLAAYEAAKQAEYRFYSFGDACFIF